MAEAGSSSPPAPPSPTAYSRIPFGGIPRRQVIPGNCRIAATSAHEPMGRQIPPNRPQIEIHPDEAICEAGDARHLRHIKKIFEIMSLIHEQPVNAEFFKRHCVVFLVSGGE